MRCKEHVWGLHPLVVQTMGLASAHPISFLVGVSGYPFDGK